MIRMGEMKIIKAGSDNFTNQMYHRNGLNTTHT